MGRQKNRTIVPPHHGAPLKAAMLTGVLLALGASMAGADPYDAALREARSQILAGQATKAYQSLESLEPALAGDPDFDYLFAVAALDSGRHEIAITTLGRLLALHPDHQEARIELARAHLESGDEALGRRQFEALQQAGLGGEARDVVRGYLSVAVPVRRGSAKTVRWFEAGAGYDSNANASTSERNFLGVTLSPENVRQSSAFGELTAGIGRLQPVGAASRLAATLRIGHRANVDASFVDQTVASADLSMATGRGPTRWTFGLGGHYGLLDGEAHQWGAGANLGFMHELDHGWSTGLRVHHGQLRYDDSNLEFFDVERTLVSLTIARAAPRGGEADLVIFGGGDEPRSTGSAFGNTRRGARLLLRTSPGSRGPFFADLSVQDVDYDDSPGFFFADRRDDLWSATLGFDLQDLPWPGWQLQPALRYSRSDSNIALYDYERYEFRLTLRRSSAK